MRRRDFLSTFAAGAALLSPAARGEQQKLLPVIGYLGAGWPDARVWVADAFRQGLMENGYVEGRNVAIEYRWAEGKTERFPELAAELVARGVDVIVTFGGTLSRSGRSTRHDESADSVPVRRRPSCGRAGRQLGAAGRQHDRVVLPHSGAHRQKGGAAEAGR